MSVWPADKETPPILRPSIAKSKAPPTLTATLGHCSICPAGHDGNNVPVIDIRHKKANHNNFLRACHRCCELLGKAVSP